MGREGGSPALTLASARYCIRRLSLQSFERVYTRIECWESQGCGQRRAQLCFFLVYLYSLPSMLMKSGTGVNQ